MRKVAQAVIDTWHSKYCPHRQVKTMQDLENILENKNDKVETVKKVCPKCNDSGFIGGPVGYDCPICKRKTNELFLVNIKT